jgi:heterodisulfide reductase subunit B
MRLEGKRNIWREYQKEIADDNYFYVRSCIRRIFSGSEQTLLRILREELGKLFMKIHGIQHAQELAIIPILFPSDTIQTIVARQFALMTGSGLFKNLMVSCITSFGIYTEITETWKEFPAEEERPEKR